MQAADRTRKTIYIVSLRRNVLLLAPGQEWLTSTCLTVAKCPTEMHKLVNGSATVSCVGI